MISPISARRPANLKHFPLKIAVLGVYEMVKRLAEGASSLAFSMSQLLEAENQNEKVFFLGPDFLLDSGPLLRLSWLPYSKSTSGHTYQPILLWRVVFTCLSLI